MPSTDVLILIAAVIALVVLGLVVGRPWVLVVPVVLGVVLFLVTADEDALAIVGAIIATLVGLAAVAVGLALSPTVRRGRA